MQLAFSDDAGLEKHLGRPERWLPTVMSAVWPLVVVSLSELSVVSFISLSTSKATSRRLSLTS
jgi:hypothetical protein